MNISKSYRIVFVLVLGVVLLLAKKTLTHKTTHNPSRKSVTGAVKQVYVSQRAIPNKYIEMKKIVEDFKTGQHVRWENLVEMGDTCTPEVSSHTSCPTRNSRCLVTNSRHDAQTLWFEEML